MLLKSNEVERQKMADEIERINIDRAKLKVRKPWFGGWCGDLWSR